MKRYEAIRRCYEVADKDLKCLGCQQNHKWLANQLTILENINIDVENLVNLFPTNLENKKELLRLKYELLKLNAMVK